MEDYTRPPRPGVARTPTPDLPQASIEDMDPTPGGRDVPPDIQLPQPAAEGAASGGKLGKLGGRFKGIFSRGKKDANKDMEEGTPSTSKTSTPVADTCSHTELLNNSKKEEGRFGKMRGRIKNIFSRGKKDDGAPAPPSAADVTSDVETGIPHPASSSFDASRSMSTGTYGTYPETKSPPSDKSTTLQSIKAFMRSPPKEEDQHPEWKKSKPKPICRSSNVLNVLLVLLIIAGIIMTALSSQSHVLRVIGPLCIGLSALALVGKIFLTLYFQEDPFPRLRPVVERVAQKIPALKKKAPSTPPPSAHEVSGRVNVSATPEAIQMAEMYPAKGMNIADEALRTSTPTLQMEGSRTPDNMYSTDYPRGPGYNRSRTPDLPYAPPRSRTPDPEVPYGLPPNYDTKPDIGDVKSRYI